ncbi:MAG: hypothetical protein WC523_01080 [Patescibacteria group bacterium]|jgi:predicted membrane protein
MKKAKKIVFILELLESITLVILAVYSLFFSPIITKPFADESVYIQLLLCGAVGVFSWYIMQIYEEKIHGWFMLISFVLLMVTLGVTFHSWLINFLGFMIFTISGIISATEFNNVENYPEPTTNNC